jgi:hypothetical protein
MILPTVANIRFRPEGPVGVDASLRLSDRSFIHCCIYADSAPILSLDDQHVSVSITVPDPEQVTPGDVEIARGLARHLDRYIAELESKIAAQDNSSAAAGDVAA